MDLFDKHGSYNYTAFKGKSGIWKCVGSETNYSNIQLNFQSYISDEILKTLDTFRLEDGTFKTVERFKVMEQFKNGKIEPIEESIVKIKPYSKKDWDKVIRKEKSDNNQNEEL